MLIVTSLYASYYLVGGCVFLYYEKKNYNIKAYSIFVDRRCDAEYCLYEFWI